VNRVPRGLRPPLPQNCPASLYNLMKLCWHQDPQERPVFAELERQLLEIAAHLDNATGRLSQPPKTPEIILTSFEEEVYRFAIVSVDKVYQLLFFLQDGI
jgi:hypothetical protein